VDKQVIWSPEAVDDLHSIVEFISKDSEYYSSAVTTKILTTTKQIGNFPLSGRIVPELNNEKIRERLVYSYRVTYIIREESVLITAIIHGKRLIENIEDRIKDT
jgi:plasmid stabilization system protein ParE